MAKQSTAVLCSLVILLAAGVAVAQDQGAQQPDRLSDEKTFNLVVGEDAEEEEEVVEEEVAERKPGVYAGEWHTALTLGYFGLDKTFLQHQRLIYRATDESFFYGDIELNGTSAFNPMLRLGYNLTTWFALETQLGLTFSDYEASLTDPFAVDPEGGTPTPVVEVGEFDLERRSALVAVTNLNGVWYPLNMDGDGEGRVHPFVTGGVGMALYNLDSNYVDETASAVNVNFGGGIRVIADDVISLRAEVLYQVHSIEFTPAGFFDERDDGTVQIPVFEFSESGEYRRAESFASETLGGLTWQLGFQLVF